MGIFGKKICNASHCVGFTMFHKVQPSRSKNEILIQSLNRAHEVKGIGKGMPKLVGLMGLHGLNIC